MADEPVTSCLAMTSRGRPDARGGRCPAGPCGRRVGTGTAPSPRRPPRRAPSGRRGRLRARTAGRAPPACPSTPGRTPWRPGAGRTRGRRRCWPAACRGPSAGGAGPGEGPAAPAATRGTPGRGPSGRRPRGRPRPCVPSTGPWPTRRHRGLRGRRGPRGPRSREARGGRPRGTAPRALRQGGGRRRIRRRDGTHRPARGGPISRRRS